MEVLLPILYILLFLFFLSLLIMIHELGHLAAAKAFNVYCFEYAIGMGPVLFSRKRKGGETKFSLRAIPFGGFVSMYGEGAELPDGVKVDPSRSLFGIKKWKRAIILVAGVVMNMVLALIFFAVANTFPQQKLYSNQINVSPNSVAEIAGIPDGTIFKGKAYEYKDPVSATDKQFYLIDKEAIINNDASVKYAVCLNYETLNSFDKRDISDYLFLYNLDTDSEPDFAQKVELTEVNNATIHFTSMVHDEQQDKYVEDQIYELTIVTEDGKFASFGINIFLETWSYDFGGVVKQTFVDFGDCSLLLFKAVGELVTKPSSWNNMGGIIAVGYETTAVLQNLGLGRFLYYWGFISVNLAIFNLLPFPGLDGWQLLVLGIEGVTRKKVPEKVKNIVSFVGLAFLLALMGFIVVKDLFRYVFIFLL